MYKLLFTSDFSLRNEEIRNKYKNALENYIIDINRNILDGKVSVSDSTYTNCMELLEMISPNSVLLKNDKNVKFIKDLDEDTIDYLYNKLHDKEKVTFLINPEGLNLRLFYKDGELIKAETYGRTFHEKDVTDLAIRVLSNRNENLDDLGDVEIVGTLVLFEEQLDYVDELCGAIDSYQGLFSLLAYDSNNPNSIGDIEDILTFVATDIQVEGFPFETIEDKLTFLEETLCFEIPQKLEYDFDNFEKEDYPFFFNNVIENFNVNEIDLHYQADALRLAGLDDDIILFKRGNWRVEAFNGVVSKIEWRNIGEEKLPVLIFDKPIRVDSSVKINEFVLNNVVLLLILNIEVGSAVRFVYFGDFGILPITENDEIIVNI